MNKFTFHLKCISCGIHIDETGFSNPRYADICDHCFVDRLNEIRRRNEYRRLVDPQQRIDSIQAECEIRIEASDDSEESEAYERILYLIKA